MTTIQRNALVPYTPHQMFELVNNIEDYPRFLPWCASSKINSQTDQEIEATLNISWAGMSKSFTTRNLLFPNKRMEMHLVNGPFRSLTGFWHFTALGEHGCKVSMDLSFEFTGSFMDKLFQPIFNQIANSLVEAFCKRAVEIYGER